VTAQPRRQARPGLATWVHQQREWSGAVAARGSRRYTHEQKQEAVALAYEVGPTEAGRQLGISKNTISGWLNKSRRDARAAMAMYAAAGGQPLWDL
jgi:transposase-like protein